jgi:hypothetical protein
MPLGNPFVPKALRAPHRIHLWKGMHVCITETMGKFGSDSRPLRTALKGYRGYIVNVTEIAPKEPPIVDPNGIDKRYIVASHHSQEHHCPSGCPACLPDSIAVDVQISAQGGQVHRQLDIAFVQPAE